MFQVLFSTPFQRNDILISCVAILPICWNKWFSLGGAGRAWIFKLLCKVERGGRAEGNAISRQWRWQQSCWDSCTCHLVYSGPSHAAISVSLAQITAATSASPSCTLAYLGALPNVSEFKRDGENSESGNKLFISLQSTVQCRQACVWPGTGHLAPL